MSVFRFRHFEVRQESSAMKVGTDAMVLGALVNAVNSRTILDIGTGTGVLALMMAQKFPEAQIDAIDIDPSAAAEAHINAENSLWNERIQVFESDLKDFQSEKKYSLIVSNPPYFTNGLLNPDRSRAQARHESALPFELLFARVNELLSDGGVFWMIAPAQAMNELCAEAERAHLWLKNRIDILGKEGGSTVRIVLSFNSNRTENSEHDCLTIRDSNGQYTHEYKALTIDFHGVRV
jgi:tRNA1Val (adenine37-N6)-methyltransferase